MAQKYPDKNGDRPSECRMSRELSWRNFNEPQTPEVEAMSEEQLRQMSILRNMFWHILTRQIESNQFPNHFSDELDNEFSRSDGMDRHGNHSFVPNEYLQIVLRALFDSYACSEDRQHSVEAAFRTAELSVNEMEFERQFFHRLDTLFSRGLSRQSLLIVFFYTADLGTVLCSRYSYREFVRLYMPLIRRFFDWLSKKVALGIPILQHMVRNTTFSDSIRLLCTNDQRRILQLESFIFLLIHNRSQCENLPDEVEELVEEELPVPLPDQWEVSGGELLQIAQSFDESQQLQLRDEAHRLVGLNDSLTYDMVVDSVRNFLQNHQGADCFVVFGLFVTELICAYNSRVNNNSAEFLSFMHNVFAYFFGWAISSIHSSIGEYIFCAHGSRVVATGSAFMAVGFFMIMSPFIYRMFFQR